MTSDRQGKTAASSAGAVPASPWLRVGEGHLTVEISARPASARRGLLRTSPAGLVIGLAAAPEKGRANRELIEFIADLLDVPASAVSVIRGHSRRQKVIRIQSAAAQVLGAKLIELTKRV
ncbi:MAG TPA: DUF167 domain-containing protein [Candidatus Binataceae bacterium]|nr:DUF167 domain-containing protein [Candidatus Binataceae bacterium]